MAVAVADIVVVIGAVVLLAAEEELGAGSVEDLLVPFPPEIMALVDCWQ
ncbi:hypothetical protein [Candidatus Paracaedibacter symbiosus]|nr:hypothetical protein [Candidatus Paracaedibacter symbiosus]